jgi:hypothetical protein
MQHMRPLHVPQLNPYLQPHGQRATTSTHSQNLGSVQMSNTSDRGKGLINATSGDICVTVDSPTLASLDPVTIHTQTLAQPMSQINRPLLQLAGMPIFPTTHYPLIHTQAQLN